MRNSKGDCPHGKQLSNSSVANSPSKALRCRAPAGGGNAKIRSSLRLNASLMRRGTALGAGGLRAGKNRSAVVTAGAPGGGATPGLAGRLRLSRGRTHARSEFRRRSVARGSRRSALERRTAGSGAAISGGDQPVYHRGGSQNRVRAGTCGKRRQEPPLTRTPIP